MEWGRAESGVSGIQYKLEDWEMARRKERNSKSPASLPAPWVISGSLNCEAQGEAKSASAWGAQAETPHRHTLTVVTLGLRGWHHLSALKRTSQRTTSSVCAFAVICHSLLAYSHFHRRHNSVALSDRLRWWRATMALISQSADLKALVLQFIAVLPSF